MEILQLDNMNLKKIIKKYLRMTGIDIIRYHKQGNPLGWLRSENISTVFDIGANIGQFAQEIRAELPDAQIYSFEPIKECHDELIRSMGNDKKFRAFQLALGDKKETKTIHVSFYAPSSSLLEQSEELKKLFPHVTGTIGENIKVERLDDIVHELTIEKPFLVKMDVQGFEDRVIEGGKETIAEADVLIIETSFIKLYEGQPLFDDIYKKLKSLGFSYNGSLRSKKDPKNGKIIFEDSIFLKQDR